MKDIATGVYRFDSVSAHKAINANGCPLSLGGTEKRMLRGETFAVERYEEPGYWVTFEDGERAKLSLEFIEMGAERLGWTIEDWKIVVTALANEKESDMPKGTTALDATPVCPACGHQYLARGCIAEDGILWCVKCDSIFPESEFCKGTKSPETHKEKTDRARQPARWHGQYSIRGSIWSPEGRCIDFETDLTEARGETFLEMIGAQFKEGGSVEPVRIPETLDEAIAALDEMIVEDLGWFMQSSVGLDPVDREQEFTATRHHGIGRWMRNEWGLWRGSPLQTHLKGLGLTHADDMSSVILTCFIRKKLGIPFDIEGQVAHYKAYWAAIEKGANEGQG